MERRNARACDCYTRREDASCSKDIERLAREVPFQNLHRLDFVADCHRLEGYGVGSCSDVSTGIHQGIAPANPTRTSLSRQRAALPSATRRRNQAPMLDLYRMSATPNPRTILRIEEVLHRTGLKRTMLYDLIARGKFPAQFSLGARAVGWSQDAVNEWIWDLNLANREPERPDQVAAHEKKKPLVHCPPREGVQRETALDPSQPRLSAASDATPSKARTAAAAFGKDAGRSCVPDHCEVSQHGAVVATTRACRDYSRRPNALIDSTRPTWLYSRLVGQCFFVQLSPTNQGTHGE